MGLKTGGKGRRRGFCQRVFINNLEKSEHKRRKKKKRNEFLIGYIRRDFEFKVKNIKWRSEFIGDRESVEKVLGSESERFACNL